MFFSVVVYDIPSGPLVYSLECVSVGYCVGVPKVASIAEDGKHSGIVALLFYFAGQPSTR